MSRLRQAKRRCRCHPCTSVGHMRTHCAHRSHRRLAQGINSVGSGSCHPSCRSRWTWYWCRIAPGAKRDEKISQAIDSRCGWPYSKADIRVHCELEGLGVELIAVLGLLIILALDLDALVALGCEGNWVELGEIVEVLAGHLHGCQQGEQISKDFHRPTSSSFFMF